MRRKPTRQLVTLDQAAAAVNRSPKTLQGYRRWEHPNPMPPYYQEGGGRAPHLYDWAAIRPWLQVTFCVALPERFPGRCIEVPLG